MHSLSRKTLFQPFTYLLQKQKQEEADYFISKQLMGCLLLSNISHPDPIPVTIPSRLFQTIFLPKKKKKGCYSIHSTPVRLKLENSELL